MNIKNPKKIFKLAKLAKANGSNEKALTLNPQNAKAKWALLRLLPLAYNSEDEINKYRLTYKNRLLELNNDLESANDSQLRAAYS